MLGSVDEQRLMKYFQKITEQDDPLKRIKMIGELPLAQQELYYLHNKKEKRVPSSQAPPELQPTKKFCCIS